MMMFKFNAHENTYYTISYDGVHRGRSGRSLSSRITGSKDFKYMRVKRYMTVLIPKGLL